MSVVQERCETEECGEGSEEGAIWSMTPCMPGLQYQIPALQASLCHSPVAGTVKLK